MSSYYNYKCNDKYTHIYNIYKCIYIYTNKHKHFVYVTDIHLFYKLILNAMLMVENIL